MICSNYLESGIPRQPLSYFKTQCPEIVTMVKRSNLFIQYGNGTTKVCEIGFYVRKSRNKLDAFF